MNDIERHVLSLQESRLMLLHPERVPGLCVSLGDSILPCAGSHYDWRNCWSSGLLATHKVKF